MNSPAPRVVLLSGDLLFGSKVEAAIRRAGGEPVLAAEAEAAREAARDAALLIVDLTDREPGTGVVSAHAPTIGFYSHTDDETRKRALAAGFDAVYPRSRLMREGEQLIRARIAG